MGKIDWSTPPTESELKGGFNTPPTDIEINNGTVGQPTRKVDAYKDVDTHGLPYPQRGIFDVLTGRNTSPQDKQRIVDQQYLEQRLNTGGPEGLESVTPFADTFNPLSLGAKVAGSAALGYGAYKAVEHPVKRLLDSTSEANKLSKDFARIPVEKQSLIFKNVKNKDKALANVDAGGKRTIGVYEKAIADGGDDARRALGDVLESRNNAISKASRSGDIEEVDNITKRMYDDMVKVVSRDNKSVYDASVLIDDLDAVGSLTARSDASERTIKSLRDRLSKNSNLTIEQALDFRKDINAELRNAHGDSYKNWKNMKDNVDKFIKSNTDESLHSFLDDTISTYARTADNKELVNILSKNEFDYKKSISELKKSNLSSPEVDATVDLLHDFSVKFANDKAISKMVATKGSNSAGSGWLGIVSAVVGMVTNQVGKVIGTQAGKNVVVQSAVLKSILKKSKTPEEFISKLADRAETPSDIKNRLLHHLKETRQSHKSIPSATNNVNKDIERSLMKSRRTRNANQNTMDKAQDRLDSTDDMISDIENKIEKAIDNGKPTGKLRNRKAKLETRRVRQERDLEKATDIHAESANKFDQEVEDSGYIIDETGKFKNPTKAERRGTVRTKE